MPTRAVAAIALVFSCVMAQGCGHSRSTGKAGSSNADLTAGKAIYLRECAACHGAQGAGTQIGPPLKGLSGKKSYRAVWSIIRDPSPPMPKLYPSRLTRAQLRDVTAYVRSL